MSSPHVAPSPLLPPRVSASPLPASPRPFSPRLPSSPPRVPRLLQSLFRFARRRSSLTINATNQSYYTELFDPLLDAEPMQQLVASVRSGCRTSVVSGVA